VPYEPRFLDRASTVRHEDKVPGLGFRCSGFILQFAKKGYNPVLHLDHAPTAFPFRVFEAPSSFSPLKGFRNAYRAMREIEIRPIKR
jgi:hypothetical protein